MSGSGSMKMSRWSKAAISLVCLRQQHAVAEHIARHVADPDHREGRGLDVAVHLAEMPLHGLPGAARGDAHLLVVIAGRAARGEGVVEPEAELLADRIGGIRKRRRALVGGDHEIGIVLVAADHILRRDHRVAVEIVGDRQQAGDEVHIGLGAGLEHRVAAAARRQALGEEAALGADRHDHRVLHLLRLDQAEHFGAIVLCPVGPAQAAARDGAEAQMHAFDLGPIDIDLTPRPRLGQSVDGARIELDRQRAVARICFGREMVGAQRRFDQVEIAADDRVVVDVRHLVQRIPDLRLEVLGGDVGLGLPGRVETGDEQGEQRARQSADSD